MRKGADSVDSPRPRSAATREPTPPQRPADLAYSLGEQIVVQLARVESALHLNATLRARPSPSRGRDRAKADEASLKMAGELSNALGRLRILGQHDDWFDEAAA